jgi:tetratricopeptide (TPR) repeat protein
MKGSRALISKGLLLAVFCTVWVGIAAAQYGSIRGTCKDAQGTPIVGAQIVWKNQNDGRTYNLKTDKKGSFFSLGIEPGEYVVTLSKDGQVLDEQKGVHVGLDEFVYDVDLKKIQQQSIADTAKKQGKSSEEVQQQVQQQQAELEKNKQYNENVKVVNDKLNAAKALMDAKNYPGAIAAYQEAANILPDKDVVWFRLGAAYADSAKAQTDPAEKTKQNTEAYNNFRKAIELGKAAPPAKDPVQAQKEKQTMAAFYDNLGAVSARLGKVDESVSSYEQAVQLDPTGASRYYFNEGITLYNSAGDEATRKKAVVALDKVLAADPNKADAYFLKGATLFAMSTQKSDGTLEPPAGTGESLQKYLELQPSGNYSDQAKGMLSMLGQKVETSFGAKSKKK